MLGCISYSTILEILIGIKVCHDELLVDIKLRGSIFDQIVGVTSLLLVFVSIRNDWILFIKSLSVCTSVNLSLEVGPKVSIVAIIVIYYANLCNIWTNPEHMRIIELCSEETSDILINLFFNLVSVKVFARHSFDCICAKNELIRKELHSEVFLCLPLLPCSVTILVCDSDCDSQILSVHYIWLIISVRASIIGSHLAGKARLCYNIVEVERETTQES